MYESVREKNPTFPNELSFWKLDSRWTPEFLKGDCKGQNSLVWRIPYTIRKLLECRCLKWACMTHLGIYNISYDQNKGRESNCQFDSQPPKVEKSPWLIMCRLHATYRWKALDEGYNFVLDLTSIKGLHKKLWTFKVARVQI
jgi:hypothetical protein